MHLDRMYLLLQRLRRNKNFSRPAFAGLKASSRGFIEVMPRASLVAYQLGKDTLHFFLGIQGRLTACKLKIFSWRTLA